jgi:RNA polymerase sigma factor (sigma-70 family)
VRRHPAPDAWVLRVTINLALDRLRQTAAAPGHVIDLREGASDPGLVVEADDDAAATRLALGAALAVLPEKQRHAVALRYLAGCDEATIAASLGINPGTVKTHLKRGLASLRTQLGPGLESPVVLPR